MATKKKGTDPSVIKGPAAAPDVAKASPAEDDVEGHNFGHNQMFSRNAAQNRERDVQHHLREHAARTEARRPFFKRGK